MDNTNANTRCGQPVGAKSSPPKQGELVGVLLLAAILFLALGLASCNVTRTITTTAQTVQRGDTTVTIMTKTVETYDGQLDAAKLLKK